MIHLKFLLVTVVTIGLMTSGRAATFTVTSTADSGLGSLRQAIGDANLTAEADTITFAIPGTGPQRIELLTLLPKITAPVVIDGSTQPGFGGTPLIELRGTLVTTSDAGEIAGVRIQTHDSVVRSICINGFNGGGIRIGGDASASNNVISGNSGDGVEIMDNLSGMGNQVVGNFIGVDSTGVKRISNAGSGIWVEGASGNLIGGAASGAGNLISGNLGNGIRLNGVAARANVVIGNQIGTDVTGTLRLGNGAVGTYGEVGNGVYINGGSNHRIGGSALGERNLISANSGDGVKIFNANGNQVLGNWIGTAASGAGDLGNVRVGVWIENASGNKLGGLAAGEPNVISGNDLLGVGVNGVSATNNAIRGNAIIANGGIPIDLGGNDVSANDNLDPDSGPNLLQNYPVLREVSGTNGFVLRGSLNSRPGATFQIDAYSALIGAAPVQVHLGTLAVTTDAAGNVDFDLPLSGSISGRYILATATDADGNTSEMSNAITAQEGVVAVGGRVVGDVSWSGNYSVTGDLVTPTGSSLTIMAGSRISAATSDPARSGNDTNRIEIRLTGGSLRVLGTSNSPVVFTSAATMPKAGDWYGLSLEGGQATLQECAIELALYGLHLRGAGTYEFSGVTSRNALYDAMWIERSGTYVFVRCHWTNSGSGVAIIGAGAECNVTFTDSDFSYNRVYGIDANSPVRLVDCRIVRNGQSGFNGNASVVLERCQVRLNGGRGVAGVRLSATDTQVEYNAQDGIAVYTANLTNCTILRNDQVGVLIYGNPAMIMNLVRCKVSTNFSDGVRFDASGQRFNDYARLAVVDSDINGNAGNGLTLGQSPPGTVITGNQITGNAIAVLLRSSLTNDLTLADGHLSGAVEIRNESARTITATNCSFSSVTLEELAKGQANLSRIYDRADNASVGPVIITNWSATPVNSLLHIVSQPESVLVLQGQEGVLSVGAESPLPLSYQWRKDGIALAGETNGVLRLPAVTASEEGDYSVIVSAGYRSLVSAIAHFEVLTQPTLSRSPAGARVPPGATIALSVEANGGRLAYQWHRGTNALTGATNSSLVVTNATAVDSGAYRVAVTNLVGAMTSSPAVVMVTEELPGELWVSSFGQGRVLRLETGSKAYLGDAVTNIPGGLQNFELGFDGLLYCASAFSNAVYQVNPVDGAILNQFVPSGADGIANVIGLGWGPNARLYIGSWGSSSILSYDNYAGGVFHSLATPGKPTGFAGGNDVAVAADGTVFASSYGDSSIKSFDSAGNFLRSTVPARTNGLASLTSFTLLPDGSLLAADGSDGGSVYHVAASSGAVDRVFIANGTGGLRAPGGLRVGPDGILYIVDAFDSSVLRFNATTGEFIDELLSPFANGIGGAFWVRYVRSRAGATPRVEVQPADIAAALGTNNLLSVTVSGSVPLAYQWRRMGAPIDPAINPTATNALLRLPMGSVTDLGQFDVLVTNRFGAVTSRVASVSAPRLTLTQEPQSASVALGTTNTLTVTATGSGLSYQWLFNGSALPNQSSNVLRVTVLDTSTLGSYQAIVANSFAAVTSSVATLTLLTNTVQFAVTNLTVSEIQGAVIAIPLLRTGSSDKLSLPLVAGGTAVAGTDYFAPSTVTVAAGSNSVVVGCRILDDAVAGGDKIFTLTLSPGNAPDVVIGTNRTVTITILDNDTALASGFGFDDDVRAIVPLPGGGAYVAGAFTSANGVPSAHIARIRSDGSLDPTFKVAGLTGTALAVAETETGDVLAGGAFLGFGRTNAALVHLTGTGEVREFFNASVNVFDIDPVSRILRAPGNRVWVIGAYNQQLIPGGSTFGSSTFIGGLETVRLLGEGGEQVPLLENSVASFAGTVARRSNGGLVGVANVRGTNRICQIDPVGRLTTVFPPVTKWTSNIRITAMAERADGGVYVVGNNTLYLVNPDGTLESSFIQTNRIRSIPSVVTTTLLLPLPDGRLLLGGNFTTINNQPRLRLALFKTDGTLSPAEVRPQLNGQVYALEQSANGEVLLGGDFTLLNGQPAWRYARLSDLARSAALEIGLEQGTVLLPETATNAVLTVRRKGSASGEVRVGYHVRPGSAQAGIDFQAADGELVFADGGTPTRTIHVPLAAANAVAEGDRTILVVLDPPSIGQLMAGASNAVVLIQDDDEGALAELHSLEYLSATNNQPLFDSLDFTHPVLTRVDREINFDWAFAAPVAGTQDRFAVRWRSVLVPPVTGPYVFYSTTDDGCQLWVDGNRLINDPSSHPANVNEGIKNLVAGLPVQMEFEFYDTVWNAAARLEWSAPGLSRQVIPETALRPVPFFENAVATNDFKVVVTNPAVPVFHHALATDGGSLNYTLTAEGKTLQDGQINFPAGQSVAWLPLPLFTAQTADTNWLLTLHDAQGGVISQRLTTSRLRFPPLLTEGPTNRTLAAGQPLNLRAAAFGAGPWTYAWQLNGTNLPAATNLLLNFPSISTGDSGDYQLIAQSGTNIFKGPLARITVTAPPTPATLVIASPTPDGQLTLIVAVTAGQSAVVESSTNLTDWQPLKTFLASGSITIQTAGQSAQFYRVRNQ